MNLLMRLALVAAIFGLAGEAGARGGGRKRENAQQSAVKQDSAKPSMAKFIKIRAPRSGQLAPDGTFYFIDRPEGTYQLFRRRDGAPKRLTSFEDGISGYELSEDGRWILVQAAVGGDEQFDIYLLDTKTDEMKALLESRKIRYDSPVWRRDSKAFAYRANADSEADFHVYLYELESGQCTKVVDREGFYFPADFNAKGTRLVVGKYMSAAHSELYEVDLTGEVAAKDRPIRRISTEEEKSFSPVGYTQDEKSFLTLSNHGGDRIHLQSIDLSDGAITPMLTELGEWDVDMAAMNADRTVLAVGINKEGYRPVHLYKVPEMKPERVIETGDEGIISNVEFAGGQMLFANDSARSPGIISKVSIDEVFAGSLTKAEPMTLVDDQGINLRQFALPELVKIKSFDGLEVPAFLYLPPGYRKGEAIRFLVTFHGGPESQFRPVFRPEIPYFLSRGFGVLAPNVRGSSGYGTEYLEADNYKNRMKSVDDGVACAKWLVAKGYSKENSIGVYGGSYGGFMVVATATRAPGVFGAACDVVGIVNFQTFLERTKAYRRKLREAEYGPLSDPDFLKSISPLYLVDKMETPMLIAHGKNDPRVPIDEATQLYEALKSSGKEVELLVFDDEGHGFRKDENRIEFYEKMADFFEAHLKKPAVAVSAGMVD